jgi:photosystem II stability/assembly factor-like uncharacterized protein
VKRVSFLVLVVLLLLMLAALSPAALAFMPVGDSSWFWLNPLPQGQTLNDVDFVDANHGWALGDGGTIIATTDGGISWTRQRYAPSDGLGALSFSDATHGWAVGGGVLSTTDGGAHWVERDVGATGLTDVSFATASTGWVCGVGGGVLRRTTDGGATWTPYDLGDPYDTWTVTEVTCTDATHAWATLYTTSPYEDYGLATTTDGGDHWAVTKPAYGYLWSHSLTFVDDAIGFLQVQGSTVGFLATTDGGANWTQRSSEYVTDMAFTDAMHGVGVTGGTYMNTTSLTYTTDGGASWTTSTWVPPDSSIAGGCSHVAFADATNVWAVGGNGAIAASTDGGATWAPDSTDASAARSFLGVSYPDPLHAWIVGGVITNSGGYDRNIVIATSDGGSTWAAQSTPTEKILNDVRFVDSTHGWAVGNAGTVIATTNGGANWTAQDSGATANLSSVAFPDATNGWVAGGGGVLHTTNGGATWAAQKAGTFVAVTFPDATHGWALTGDSRVVRTTDGGTHWTAPRTLIKSLNPLIRTSDVVFTDTDHGWIVGATISLAGGYQMPARGLILATTDGGLTWTEQRAGTDAGLSDVRFISPTTGWATGGDSILSTTDGGKTWSLQTHGAGTSLSGIAFADPSHGLAVGSGASDIVEANHGATIIGTTTGGVTAAPMSTASGISAWAWYNHDVTVNFSAVASPLGGSVVHTEYDLGKGAGWVDGSSCVFPASDPGMTSPWPYVVSYRAVDDAGNVEYTRTLVLHCDTFPPVPMAPRKASASRGKAATLSYFVRDYYGGGTAVVTIKVKSPSGKVVKTLKCGPILTVSGSTAHGLLTKRFTVPRTWKRGTYKFLVYATDTAGNPQVKAASNRLIVK